MRILTICAHPNPESFCHAVQRRFAEGARGAGHEVDSIDLHAVRFDPVFKQTDYLQFLDETQLPDVEIIRGQLIAASGGAIRRKLAGLWLRNKPLSELLKLIAAQRPKDVQWHQQKVALADALVFIAPIFWMGFPAILKGWIERVFTYGFAYSLTPQGWKGDLSGRIPLLKHKKALVITPTFFSEAHYSKGWEAAVRKVLDEWTFTNTGIADVEHVFLYAVNAADENARKEYLEKAYRLGKDF
jgi:NAD(P)H dehydrogenase (quinone)